MCTKALGLLLILSFVLTYYFQSCELQLVSSNAAKLRKYCKRGTIKNNWQRAMFSNDE